MRWGLLAMTAGLLLLALTTPGAEAARRMKGGKQHHRSKRTIGAIINWKLNLLQNIFGGISGIFGGGSGSGGGGGSSSSYGAPSQSYGVPSQSYGAPARDGLLYVNLCFFSFLKLSSLRVLLQQSNLSLVSYFSMFVMMSTIIFRVRI